MNTEELIRNYVPSKQVMQLATSVNNQPWVCTVHYFSDDGLNLYWISTEERRHSQEIAQNPNVTGYILVHQNTPEENYVIGLSFEGKAEYIGENIDEKIGQAYVDKLQKPANLLADIKSGANPHKFYKLTPTKFVLFDSKNFPQEPRQEWNKGE